MPKRLEAILLFALAAEIAVFSTIAPNFFTLGNAFEIICASIEVGLLAIALTPILVTAGIDLSAGSMKRAIQPAIILATVGLTATRKPQHA